MADALLWYRLNNGAAVDGAIMNSGGLRASIDAGPVTRGQILTTFPFLNAVTEIKLTGQELWDLFEGISPRVFPPGQLLRLYSGAVSGKNAGGHAVTSTVQISQGMSLTWDSNRLQGSRLVSLSIGQSEPVPPVDLKKTYTIATLDYIASGGTGFCANIASEWLINFLM